MKLAFVAFLVLLNSTTTHQQNSCKNVIKKYNGRPLLNVISNIRSHSCSGGLCCPDGAVDVPEPKLPDIPPPPQNSTNSKIDYNSIKNHRNVNLINEKTCGTYTSNNIVDGANAGLREFPWAALLGYQLTIGVVWQCGGTLIAPKFVLTACHCITRDLAFIRLGEHTISKQVDCDDSDQCADPVQDIMIDSKIRHKEFNRDTKENDLALLKLARPADTTKNNVKTICLPISPESDIEEFKKSRNNFVATGWGKKSNGISSDILKKNIIPFINLNKCNAILNPFGVQIYATQFCAGHTMKEIYFSCRGDEGSGLMAVFTYNEKPRALLYGVNSAGTRCGNQNLINVSVYVNIKFYFNWILDNISA